MHPLVRTDETGLRGDTLRAEHCVPGHSGPMAACAVGPIGHPQPTGRPIVRPHQYRTEIAADVVVAGAQIKTGPYR
jgi:hypothetical protein